jgi:uncharacterized protein
MWFSARRCVPLLAALWVSAAAQAGAPVPEDAPPSWIHDGAGLLSPSERDALSEARARLEARAGMRLAVVTLRSADGEAPKSVAVRTLNAWNAGRKSAVLLVLMSPRKLYIQPGTDLAGVLDEPTSSSICASVIAPKLRAGDKAGAILAGLEAIADKVASAEPVRPEDRVASTEAPQPAQPEWTPPPEEESDGPPFPLVAGGAIALFAIGVGGSVWSMARAARRKCDRCRTPMQKERRVFEEPTYTSTGRGELHYACGGCGFSFTEALVLPILVESAVSSSTDTSWSSSSDSSSSSSSSSDSSSSSGSGGGGSDW